MATQKKKAATKSVGKRRKKRAGADRHSLGFGDVVALDEDRELEAVHAAARRRWAAIITDPRVAIGYKTDSGWERSSKPPTEKGDYDRIGIFHRNRLWVRREAIPSLQVWLSDAGGVPVTVESIAELAGYANDHSVHMLSPSLRQFALGGDRYQSAASLALRAGWVLFDFSLGRGIDIFAVLNNGRFGSIAAASPFYTFAWDFAPWDFGTFGFPASPGALKQFENAAAGGAGVTVVVSDSGMATNMASQVGAQVLSDVVQNVPVDYEDPYMPVTSNVIADGAGHGTFVASIIKKLVPDATVVVSRVWTTNRVLVDETELFDDTQRALGAFPGKLILNWSLSSAWNNGAANPFDDIVNTAIWENGDRLLIVCAAGNHATPNRDVRPAGLQNTQLISVGAVTRASVELGQPAMAGFSNSGPLVKVWAIGTNVVAQYPPGVINWVDSNNQPQQEVFAGANPAARWSGTSFAAPIVAARAARLFSNRTAPELALAIAAAGVDASFIQPGTRYLAPIAP